MLVLSRKPGEQIFIGDNIVVTVTRVDDRGKVRVGIQAPRAVQISRGELLTEEQRAEIEDRTRDQS